MAPSKAKDAKEKAEQFLNNRKNANNLTELIGSFQDPSSVHLSNILSLDLIFVKILSRGDLSPEILQSEDSVEIKYWHWLKEHYDVGYEKLINTVILSSKLTVQLQALSTVFKIMAEEGKHPIESNIDQKFYYFPKHRLKILLSSLIQSDKSIKKLLTKFEEITSTYLDVIYFSWVVLVDVVKEIQNPSEVNIKNTMLIIDKLVTAKTEEKQLKAYKELKPSENLLCYVKGKKVFKADLSILRNAASNIWPLIRNWPHTVSTHTLLLTVLNERILHNLEKPLGLADFLMDSLDFGGPRAVLALQAIFFLIIRHNFDCAKIFKKLYALFEPNIFHTTYKARLFYLANVCFSSTHLSENLVAAFMKRLARLSLKAPAADIIIIAAFVGNLMIRHPTLQRLIHAQHEKIVGSDPFLEDEADPELTHALESSLWELKTLQSHILPNVAGSVKYIDQNLQSLEWDLNERLENSYSNIFDKEMKKKGVYSVTFERPTSICLPRGEQLSNFWNIVA